MHALSTLAALRCMEWLCMDTKPWTAHGSKLTVSNPRTFQHPHVCNRASCFNQACAVPFPSCMPVLTWHVWCAAAGGPGCSSEIAIFYGERCMMAAYTVTSAAAAAAYSLWCWPNAAHQLHARQCLLNQRFVFIGRHLKAAHFPDCVAQKHM